MQWAALVEIGSLGFAASRGSLTALRRKDKP
jgi:hypothetical protein